VRVPYNVRDLDAGRAFYRDVLGFIETAFDYEQGWSELERGDMEITLYHAEPDPEGPVAMVDVEDVKSEAERLRVQGVEVGVVLDLAGQMRIVDVYDPDGNRVQLAQELTG
jgi:catechol 2,3-dioxygenase-like lactoylglutathione lyase family enzyme